MSARSRGRGSRIVRDRLHGRGTVAGLRNDFRRRSTLCGLVFRGRWRSRLRPMKYGVIMAGVALRRQTGSQRKRDHSKLPYFCTRTPHKRVHASHTVVDSRT